jgi:hypothetical protein
MLCPKTHSYGFFRALPKQRLEPPSGSKASFVREVNEIHRALDAGRDWPAYCITTKQRNENSKMPVTAQLTGGRTNDMRAQIERWENEGGSVPFIEKQSGRFKTGVAIAEKEMAGTTSIIEHLNQTPHDLLDPTYKEYLASNAELGDELARLSGDTVNYDTTQTKIQTFQEKLDRLDS